MRQIKFLFGLGMLFLLGCSEPEALQVMDRQEARPDPVEFRATTKALALDVTGLAVQTSWETSNTPDCIGWRTTHAGTATDKKLGAFEVTTNECLTYDPATGVFSNDGTATFTHVATGDDLYLTFQVSAGPADANDIAEVYGAWTLVGGTGQFYGATGAGIYKGTQAVVEEGQPVTFYMISKDDTGGKFKMKGRFSRTSSQTSNTPDCTGWRTTHAGTAEEKKFGAFNAETVECLTYQAETGVYTSDGTATFKHVATTDKLYVTFLTHAGPANAKNIAEVYGAWTISGGTGQFSGARGAGTLTGTQVVEGDYPVTFTMEGSISICVFCL